MNLSILQAKFLLAMTDTTSLYLFKYVLVSNMANNLNITIIIVNGTIVITAFDQLYTL